MVNKDFELVWPHVADGRLTKLEYAKFKGVDEACPGITSGADGTVAYMLGHVRTGKVTVEERFGEAICQRIKELNIAGKAMEERGTGKKLALGAAGLAVVKLFAGFALAPATGGASAALSIASTSAGAGVAIYNAGINSTIKELIYAQKVLLVEVYMVGVHTIRGLSREDDSVLRDWKWKGTLSYSKDSAQEFGRVVDFIKSKISHEVT